MRWEPIGVIGHRGGSAHAPENTMASFAAAQSLGADGIEFDVHRTADGVLTVIHDFELARTTDGHGIIFESTWPEVATLDAGSWFGDRFVGQRVPRLEEVLELEGLDFELEIKGFGAGIIDDVLRAVDEAGVLDRVKFTGWNTSLLAELKRRRPEARTGLFSRPREGWMTNAMFEHTIVGMAEYSGADIFHVYAADLTTSIVDRLHQFGGLVQANDATSADEMVAALVAGADFIAGNDVAEAVDARNGLRIV